MSFIGLYIQSLFIMLLKRSMNIFQDLLLSLLDDLVYQHSNIAFFKYMVRITAVIFYNSQE